MIPGPVFITCTKRLGSDTDADSTVVDDREDTCIRAYATAIHDDGDAVKPHFGERAHRSEDPATLSIQGKETDSAPPARRRGLRMPNFRRPTASFFQRHPRRCCILFVRQVDSISSRGLIFSVAQTAETHDASLLTYSRFARMRPNGARHVAANGCFGGEMLPALSVSW